MSNWFETNPTKSVVSYTIIIVAATWAVSTFVLQDNRLNLAQSQLESQKALTEQYRSKVDLLQRDIDSLRVENAEYREWLGQAKDAIPVIVPRITALKEKVALLEAELKRSSARGSIDLDLRKQFISRVGRAFVDDTTGLIITVKKTQPDRTADVIVKFPEEDTPVESTISPGQQWVFNFKEKDYTLTVTTISYLGDYIEFRIATGQ